MFFRVIFDTKIGGVSRSRTGDLMPARQVLSQLSYHPKNKITEKEFHEQKLVPPLGQADQACNCYGLEPHPPPIVAFPLSSDRVLLYTTSSPCRQETCCRLNIVPIC